MPPCRSSMLRIFPLLAGAARARSKWPSFFQCGFLVGGGIVPRSIVISV